MDASTPTNIITQDGFRLTYEKKGHGTPLLLIHGLSGSRRWWKKSIPSLAQEHTVYAIDLIGFGDSREQPFRLRDAARIVWEWWEQECSSAPQPLGLVAHSMGGYVAAEIAAHHPRQVNHLVLVDALAQPIQRSVTASFFHLLRAWPKFASDFYACLIYDAYRAGMLTLTSAIYQLHYSTPVLDPEQLRAKTLIVWGAHDVLLPVSYAYELQERLPQANLVVLPEAGHVPMWEQPELFNQTVLQFLRDVPARQSD